MTKTKEESPLLGVSAEAAALRRVVGSGSSPHRAVSRMPSEELVRGRRLACRCRVRVCRATWRDRQTAARTHRRPLTTWTVPALVSPGYQRWWLAGAACRPLVPWLQQSAVDVHPGAKAGANLGVKPDAWPDSFSEGRWRRPTTEAGACRPSQGLCSRWGTAPQQPSPRPKRAPHSLIMTSGDPADPLVRLAVRWLSRRPGSLLSGSRPSSWGYRQPGCRQTTPVSRSMGEGRERGCKPRLPCSWPRITPTMRSFCFALGSQRAMCWK